ncbi:MAG: sugar phosphate isomerase/epimerase family protein [Pirellulaceae bacterium]
MISRREMLLSMASAHPASQWLAADTKRTEMGIAEFSYNTRIRSERKAGKTDGLSDPLKFLEHCHAIGAGGIQKSLGVRDADDCRRLRNRAEQLGMYVEGSADPPRRDADLDRFEAMVRTAKECGARVLRAAMGGRRYEVFDRAEQHAEWSAETRKAVERAEPILAKHKVRLAIENHKDRRVEEMLDLLESLDSEYVGMCVDTGNDLSLLTDALEMTRAYAPWAHTAHVKDAAVAEYEKGFLLADVALGQGILNLKEIIRVLHEANPHIQLALEMSTRDPLRVPCLTEKYWATLRHVSGRDLARTLRMVRENSTPKARLPHVEHLATVDRVQLEEENIRKCLAYAREHLSLS